MRHDVDWVQRTHDALEHLHENIAQENELADKYNELADKYNAITAGSIIITSSEHKETRIPRKLFI